MGNDKAGLGRFGLSSNSQFMPDDSRLLQNPLQFRPTSSTTGDLSEMQRLVQQQGSYLNNNVELSSLERSMDIKPTLQHMSAYDNQISSANPMGMNPALMTSGAGKRAFPFTNCHI